MRERPGRLRAFAFGAAGWALVAGVDLARGAGEPAAAPVVVRIETELGSIDIEVDLARAPVTGANFLRYVDAGRYDGGRFHRTVRPDNELRREVPIEVVQAGVAPGHAGHDFPPIPLERTRETGLRHLDGAVSMARDEPDSATSDFFVCVGDQPALDFGGARNPDGQGFAAFGRVVAGLDVVRRIQASPAEDQNLTPPIAIRSARRVAPGGSPSPAPGPEDPPKDVLPRPAVARAPGLGRRHEPG